MDYLLIFYAGNEIKQITLKNNEIITVGNSENDTLKIINCGLSAEHLNLNNFGYGINIFSKTPFDMAGEKYLNRIISAGDFLNINSGLKLAVIEKYCDCNITLALNNLSEISIGRSSKNDICLKNSLVSSAHAVIRKINTKWVIKDRQSRNGIFINGTLLNNNSSFELNNGAVIFIGGFILEFKNDSINFINTPGSVIFSDKILNETLSAPIISGRSFLFSRSPRMRKTATNSEIEIFSPPNISAKPSISWGSILLPPVLMAGVMFLAASFTKNFGTLFYTLPMSCVSVFMAFFNYRSQNKKWLQSTNMAVKKYFEHLQEKELEITKLENEYTSILSAINPGIFECISIAKNINRRLWERTSRDSDFLNIRVGTSSINSNVNIKIPKTQLTLEENTFLKEAENLKERHKILNGVPVCHSFLNFPVTGLIGNNENLNKMIWSIIINIAVHHSYEDVKIICIYPERDKNKWEWLRWLPHVWNSEKTRRFMSCTLKSDENNNNRTAREILRELSEILKLRQKESKNNLISTPFYFFIFADKNLVESSGEKFLPDSSSYGYAVLYAYGDISSLPLECNAVIDCGDPDNKINASIQMTNENNNINFIPDYIYIHADMLEKFSRSLAPVRVQSSGGLNLLPSKVLFFEGLGSKTVEGLNILSRWNKSQSYKSLAVPIGIKNNGDMFYFDVHEKSMGPHGVIAGTSGSGKSEMLTAWLLSLVMHFSPKDLNILLIEFKGNDLSNILITLPHIAGVVNNLQVSTAIERSLISLSAEYKRRLQIFESVTDLATKSLPAYQKYYKDHPDENLTELPYLIVVLDEFAEFKKQFPDQIDKFVQLARVGRSAGLYMVLSTQSPSGVVPAQIESNIKFYICLRTANTGESKELLGTPDAFFISNPGRAYVKSGDSIYEQVQTFYSKEFYNPNNESENKNKNIDPEINLIKIDGERVKFKNDENENNKSQNNKTEGQILVSYIKELAQKNNFENAKPVWTKELPEFLTLSELDEKYKISRAFKNNIWSEINTSFKFSVGLLDVPEQQKQEPFILDFTNNGHQILFGAPSSGKTTFLQTAILSAALSYTPEQINFIILDFGSWSMRTFENLPHTLMIAYAGEKEKLQKAEEFLINELNTRKNLFADQGVGTLEAYKQISGKNLPAILIAIDNITVLNNQYSEMIDTIIKISSEGGNLGIYLLITCSGSSFFKLDNYIKSKHALELTDITEYRSLVGAASKQKPGNFKGRGFTRGPLEFQTALCVTGENEGERVKNLRDICSAMRDAWGGGRASIEEAENAEININDLEINGDFFQIGINKNSKQPVKFIFSDMTACIISGNSEAGIKNLICLMINALSHDPDAKIYLYDESEEISGIYSSCEIIKNSSGADLFMSDLADEFDRRNNEENLNNNSRIIFLIDDFLKFYRGISQESADILEVITRSGSDFNIYVYIASSFNDLGFLNTFRKTIKPFDNCIKKGNAVISGGNISDYVALKDMHNETNLKFSNSEGCLIHAGKVTPVKFARVGA